MGGIGLDGGISAGEVSMTDVIIVGALERFGAANDR